GRELFAQARVAPRDLLAVKPGPGTMSPTLWPPLWRNSCVLLLALTLLALAPPAAAAAEPAALVPAASLPAFDMMDIVHDRSRLIQFSIIAVAIGIGLLWWGQKT